MWMAFPKQIFNVLDCSLNRVNHALCRAKISDLEARLEQAEAQAEARRLELLRRAEEELQAPPSPPPPLSQPTVCLRCQATTLLQQKPSPPVNGPSPLASREALFGGSSSPKVAAERVSNALALAEATQPSGLFLHGFLSPCSTRPAPWSKFFLEKTRPHPWTPWKLSGTPSCTQPSIVYVHSWPMSNGTWRAREAFS